MSTPFRPVSVPYGSQVGTLTGREFWRINWWCFDRVSSRFSKHAFSMDIINDINYHHRIYHDLVQLRAISPIWAQKSHLLWYCSMTPWHCDGMSAENPMICVLNQEHGWKDQGIIKFRSNGGYLIHGTLQILWVDDGRAVSKISWKNRKSSNTDRFALPVEHQSSSSNSS